VSSMDHDAFDSALIAAFFRLAAAEGWQRANVVVAARAADLPLATARERFPGKAAVLLRFGRMADQAALNGAAAEGPAKDRLFDLLMRRFDAMQPHRAGILALMRALPSQPGTALLLTCATRRGMRWMLQAAGCGTSGVRGALRVRGLVAVWLWALRAWDKDETEDMSATMAALDTALGRADRLAGWLGGGRRASPAGEAEIAEEPPPGTESMGEDGALA
jgi:ubiquinone biosynthesis protein COQ9